MSAVRMHYLFMMVTKIISSLWKILLTLLSVMLFALTLVFSVTAIQRWRLPYNEEGNYFDAANSVVYHEGAGDIYALMAVLSATAGLLFSCWAYRACRPKTDHWH